MKKKVINSKKSSIVLGVFDDDETLLVTGGSRVCLVDAHGDKQLKINMGKPDTMDATGHDEDIDGAIPEKPHGRKYDKTKKKFD